MKRYIILIGLMIINFQMMAGGGEDAYMKAMQAGLKSLYAADAPAAFDACANRFLRIAEAEKSRWLPYYYGSLAYVWKSFRLTEPGEKDEQLETAMTILNKAFDLGKPNSELLALQGFIYMLQISNDPAARGQTLTVKAFGSFNAALKMDPTNPRAMLFKGQMQHGTAKFFGSGTDEACATIAASVKAFENTNVEDTIEPAWGRGTASEWLTRCQPDVVADQE